MNRCPHMNYIVLYDIIASEYDEILCERALIKHDLSSVMCLIISFSQYRRFFLYISQLLLRQLKKKADGPPGVKR